MEENAQLGRDHSASAAAMDGVAHSHAAGPNLFDDDGHPRRNGTMWTASAHIITAVIGSGVLSLGWAIAQLGWVAGPAVMVLFSLVTYYTSALLADCYRSGDPVTGKRNYTYMDAVNTNLSGFKVKLCGFLQYANIVGVAIGYTIAASISMLAIRRANCFHKKGHGDRCNNVSSTPYMIIFGVAEVFFSQIPDFDHISWLSLLAAVMSFTYSVIGLSLAIVQVVANGGFKGSLTGISIGVVTPMDKVWRSLQAFGDIAFAYSYSLILIEIQDTIRAPPPPESKVMKHASVIVVAVTTLFFMLCGGVGYAAFGDDAPDNPLTAFGFYEPFWLVAVANAAIVVHVAIAYQKYCRALSISVEEWAKHRWLYTCRDVEIGGAVPSHKLKLLLRLIWWTAFVVVTTASSVLLRPFFHDVFRLLSALSYCLFNVYFPVEIYMVQKKVPRWSTRWVCLQMLSIGCFITSFAAAAGAVAGVVWDLKGYRPFKV